jgi:hypothetical protein
MLNGCRHYGVEPNYIKRLEQHECTPRPSPDEYLSFPVQEGAMDRTMTRQQAHEQGNGQDGNPLWVCSNGRVIQLCEDNNSPFFREFCKTMSTYGKDVEMFIARVQYDPKYGNPQSIEEISPEESAYREHGFCQYMQGINKLDKWQVIAKIVDGKK